MGRWSASIWPENHFRWLGFASLKKLLVFDRGITGAGYVLEARPERRC